MAVGIAAAEVTKADGFLTDWGIGYQPLAGKLFIDGINNTDADERSALRVPRPSCSLRWSISLWTLNVGTIGPAPVSYMPPQ